MCVWPRMQFKPMATRQQTSGLTSALSVCFLIFPTTGLGRKRLFNKLPLVKQERVSTLRYWSSSYEGGSESLAITTV